MMNLKKTTNITAAKVIPPTPQHATLGLKDMALSDLEEASNRLKEAPSKLQQMSGVCAVLHGLILSEIKSRLKHKQWTPWLKSHWKTGQRDARKRMQLASAFSKAATRGDSEQLRLNLPDAANALALDLQHPTVKKVSDWTAGRSYSRLLEEETGDGRENNPGGFRPNALILRVWLEENYPQHPEYLEFASCFGSLPEEVQKRFRTEGKRYEQRFTKEQLEELETAEAARGWNTRAPKSIFDALDNGFFDRAENDQLSEWQKALGDALERVNRQVRDRATLKKGRAAK